MNAIYQYIITADLKILLLEPDHWRSLGILQILKADGSIVVFGEEDHKKILSLRSAPPTLDPDIVLISHSLTFDYQLAVLQHIHRLFPRAQILVAGYDESLDAIADVLRGGAKGYFHLSSEPAKLLKALAVVSKGHIWAPREAVALLMNAFSGESASELIPAYDVAILQLLQQGLSNKEIARSLGVAEVTIKSHLTKLYRRFRVHTRLELLAYAMVHHLIAGLAAHTPAGSRHGV